MRKPALILILLFVLGAIAQAQDYQIIKEGNSSFGNIRSRIVLEIEIPSLVQPTIQGDGDLSRVMREALQVMMTAGVDRHRQGQPDVVSVRLWKSYEDDLAAFARLVYAPDGCGRTGDDCTNELWTEFWYCSSYSLEHDMLHNCNGQPIPEDLRDWEQTSTELGITQAQRPENPLKEPSVFELMAQIAVPSGSVGERERLEENFEDILPKIDLYCPDLEGSMQVGDVTVYFWQLLADAGTQVELTNFTVAFLASPEQPIHSP